jgi:hypothetical protein
VTYAIEGADGELLPPTKATADELRFDFHVRLASPSGEEAPRLLGEFVRGTPSKRFIYVNSGTYGGQADSPWSRRAKVFTHEIDRALVDAALASGRAIETRIAGTGRDGGPCAATVPLIGGWRLSA